MKVMGMLTVLSAVVAEATAHNSEYGAFTPWANVGALVAVVGLLIFMSTKLIPQIIRDHASERAQMIRDQALERATDRKEWLSQLDKRDAVNERVAESLKALMTNCAARAEQFRNERNG